MKCYKCGQSYPPQQMKMGKDRVNLVCTKCMELDNKRASQMSSLNKTFGIR